jgi:2-hydroxychromene-2-carboxylate isomerase
MKAVDVYFDYASPWSYVALETSAQALPGITLTWKPVYLRGLETFSKGMPYTSSKLAYLMQDFQRITAHEKVAVQPPANFPIDGLHALRAAFVAQDRGVFAKYHRAAFRATWAQSKNISDRAVVAEILAEAAGVPSSEVPALLEAMGSQSVKDRLRAETAAAEARGVFGVPSFFVGDEMFWGSDRFGYIARAAAAT